MLDEDYENKKREKENEYNQMVVKINAMPWEEIDELIKNDKCPYDPETLLYQPIGQHHCLKHLDYSTISK